ncbi:MAG: UDP-2,3-diacylglucosamine diphosphatase [Planctomycetes bacterium]|nr:UDP-2,3-diacylglucosamine diphosphatase [Planctomycetota bacterium]
MADRLIVSDVHLSAGDPSGVDRFVAFLTGTAAGARSLVIAGDLFEFWVTPDQAREPSMARVFGALRHVVDAGTPVGFIEGNRDFAASPELRSVGVTTLADVVAIDDDSNGSRARPFRVAVTHGDLLCRKDVRYQAYRRVARTPLVRHLLRAAPASIAQRSGRAARAGSKREMARKSEGEMGLDAGAVAEMIRAHDADALVCGHVHWGRCHRIEVDGASRDVVVLGAWDAGDATFARIGGGRLTFERFAG